jgi:hypothetical protein
MTALEEILRRSQQTARMWEDKAIDERQFFAVLSELIVRLPTDLPYSDISRHTAYAVACVKLRAVDLEASRPMVSALPPLPAVKIRDGCCSIRPADNVPERGEVSSILGVWVDFDNVTKPSMVLNWFTKVADVILKVETTVENVHQYARWTGHRRVTHGQVILENRTLHYKLNSSSKIKWWTPPESHLKVTVYWPTDATFEDVFRSAENEYIVR